MQGMRLKGLKDGMMRCGLGIGLVADDGSGGRWWWKGFVQPALGLVWFVWMDGQFHEKLVRKCSR
jgi:hypothetical protein